MTKKFIIPVLLMMFISVPAFSLDFGEAAYVSRGGLSAGLVLNPEGKGDLLIFPYFDVRPINGKAQDTLFVIINEGTGDYPNSTFGELGGVAAKLRFREWDKSLEIFDAEIWLSKNDVWVGVVTLNPVTGLARITSPDYVIIDPPGQASPFTIRKVLKDGFDFLTSNITGFTLPAGWTVNQMTHLGYFEVIGEELTVAKAASPGADQTTVVRIEPEFRDCPNTLMGQAFIVRVNDGVMFGYNATAFANFSRREFELGEIESLYDAPGSLIPKLDDAQDTLDQLEFQLSKEDIFAAYSIEEEIGAKASLIITFPTKHFHYANNGRGARIAGSNNPFTAPSANAGEEIVLNVYNRDEQKITPERSWWSPPPVVPPLSLPYEVNICGMYSGLSPVTGGYSDRNNVAFPAGDFKTGWIWVALQAKSAEPVLIPYYGYFGNAYAGYNGLPAIGLQLQEATNFAAGGYYGDMNEAWYEFEWEPAGL
jgi:hypothetical protein